MSTHINYLKTIIKNVSEWIEKHHIKFKALFPRKKGFFDGILSFFGLLFLALPDPFRDVDGCQKHQTNHKEQGDEQQEICQLYGQNVIGNGKQSVGVRLDGEHVVGRTFSPAKTKGGNENVHQMAKDGHAAHDANGAKGTLPVGLDQSKGHQQHSKKGDDHVLGVEGQGTDVINGDLKEGFRGNEQRHQTACRGDEIAEAFQQRIFDKHCQGENENGHAAKMQGQVFPDDEPRLVAFSEGPDDVNGGVGQRKDPHEDHFGLAGSVFKNKGGNESQNHGQSQNEKVPEIHEFNVPVQNASSKVYTF